MSIMIWSEGPLHLIRISVTYVCQLRGACSPNSAGPTKDIDNSGNPYVDQFIRGCADSPIKMAIRK